MARVTTIQHFRSIAEFKTQHRLILPKPYDWRLLEPCVIGQIHGIPGSHGTAVATNGILVAIVQDTGIFIGHEEFFIADIEEREHKATTSKPTKNKKPMIDISEFA